MVEYEVLKKTISVCPECLKPIPAEIYVDPEMGENGWVMMRKTCKEHGEFKDKISSNPELYKWKHSAVPESSWMITAPQNTPKLPVKKGCPFDCGLCENHKSAANLMIIDITNRCNLNCPICFANSNSQGRIVEYTYEEVVRIMEHFANQKPFKPAIAQFSGGEPTLHPRIIDILKKAMELFPHVMLNTNGVRMAKDIEFTRAIKETGIGAIYLSFDGFGEEVYKKIRGLDLTRLKQKFIENCREVGLNGVMLVTTVVNGINNHQIKDIIDYARDNNDVVAGVVFQPVSLSGRIAMEDLMKLRYTSSDLIEEVKKATNGVVNKFYPLALSSKLTALLPWFENLPSWAMTAEEDCGWATIVPVDDEGNYHSIDEYVDVYGVVEVANEIWDMIQKREIPKPSKFISPLKKYLYKFGLGNLVDAIAQFSDNMSDWAYRQAMKAYFIARVAPYVKNFDPKKITSDHMYESIIKLLLYPGLENSKGMLHNRNLFIGCMHFQDAYDLDVKRTERCLVHYGVLDPANPQRVLEIPFCTFNTLHREPIEREWAKTHARQLDKSPEEIAQEMKEFVENIQLKSDLE